MNNQDFFPTRQASNFSLMQTDPSIVAAAEAAKARIQSAYIMALQKPREEMVARDRILTACKRTEFAGRAEFKKPQGKIKENGRWVTNYVMGPSIRFAELALREWGNIMSEVQTLYEDEDVRRVRVSVLDLETNAQFTKDIQLKKTVERKSNKGREDDVISERVNSYGQTVYILKATDEEMYTKEAAWVSKVLRNEGLRLIPTDIIEEGMQQARLTIANKADQDPEGEKKKILDAFSSLGVKPRELEKYIKHNIETLSPAEIVNLRTVYQSIRDGETTWADYINEADQGEPEPLDTSEFDKLASTKIDYPPDATLDRFLEETAKANNVSVDEIKIKATGQFDAFWQAFEAWLKKSQPKKKAPEKPKEDPEKSIMAELMTELNAIPEKIRQKAAEKLKCSTSPITLDGKQQLLDECNAMMGKEK